VRKLFWLLLLLSLCTGCEGLPDNKPDASVDWDGYHPPDLFNPADKTSGGCDGGSDVCSRPD
jgi:hypothetical protein